jgi:pimeloyl-ACP methyl ester carboxylesterase
MPGVRGEQNPIQPGMKPRAQELADSGDNYWLYQRDTGERVFAVVGAGADPGEYEKTKPAGTYRRIDMRAFARILAETARDAGAPGVRLLLYIHGYNNASSTVRRIGDQLADVLGPGPARPETADCLWVTYDWPGRAFWTWDNWRSSKQTFIELAVATLYWLPVLLLAALPGALLWYLAHAWRYAPLYLTLALLLMILPALVLLRFVAYHRDRYMALHRGVPDLCEFVRHLEAACRAQNLTARLNFVAHSMGCMLTLNAVRTLSNLFEHDPGLERPNERLSDNLTVGRLLLAAPDLPVELLRLSQNNYFYAAMRRFERMYVFASAHDAVLRVLSWLINSFQEPQPGLDRYRLGNVLFSPASARSTHPSTDDLARRVWFRTRPLFENTAHLRQIEPEARRKVDAGMRRGRECQEEQGLPAGAAPELNAEERYALLYGLILERVSFIDCSRLPRMGAWLHDVWYPPFRDLLSLLWNSVTHSGYFDEPTILARMGAALHGSPKSGERENEVL